jgi:hypothetical protein
MPLSWNGIKSRAIGYAKAWADASDERAQAQSFWIDFFAVFGLRACEQSRHARSSAPNGATHRCKCSP